MHAPKQMIMTVHPDMNKGSHDIVHDYIDTLSGQSFRGKDTANQLVKDYISRTDKNERANENTINRILNNFEDIGIVEIQSILKEKGAEPLGEKILLEIMKTNKKAIEELGAEGEKSGNEFMQELNAQVDFNGTADTIVKLAGSLKEPAYSLLFDKYTKRYIEDSIDNFIAERVLKPKIKNSMKGRMRILDKSIQKDINRYLYCSEFNVPPYKGDYGQQPSLWTQKTFIIKQALAKREKNTIDKAKKDSK